MGRPECAGYSRTLPCLGWGLGFGGCRTLLLGLRLEVLGFWVSGFG